MGRLLILNVILMVICSGINPICCAAEAGIPAKSLHAAAADGDVDQIRLLISRGADVNAKDKMEYTPLFYAAEKGQTKSAEVLIMAGGSVNVKDQYGNTPLHYAAVRGHYPLCELLIAHGADVSAKNLAGGTPLMMAKAGNHIRVIELLRKYEARGGTPARDKGRKPVEPNRGARSEKPIWLVVTRPMFEGVLRPLADKRVKDGFEVVVSTQSVREAVAALKRQPAFLLLVGDDQPGAEDQPWYIPSPRRQLYRWRATQEEEFAADVVLGDFDSDLIPDIPVGRIPVRSVQQLDIIIRKILVFEDKQPTLDDLRLLVWVGSAGYNQTTNVNITELLLNTIQTNAPIWLRPWVISADPAHSLCGWPPEQGTVFTEQMKRGGLMGVLIGHGTDKFFDSMSFRGQNIRYSAEEVKAALNTGVPVAPMVIIACSTGRFTGEEDCLAESLLLMSGGPVAVIGATTESHPLTNYFTSLCALKELGRGQHKDKRLGSVWLAAQRQAMITREPAIEQKLSDIEGKLEEQIDIAKLRRDQILMYALLGDPATRLHLPDELASQIKYGAYGWQWVAEKATGANKLHVSFRPEGQSFPRGMTRLERTTAWQLFTQADQSFSFRPMGEFAVGSQWSGTINQRGILRLVATGPERIYAAVFKLGAPGEQQTVTQSQAEAELLADPNVVRARVRGFEGLEKALVQVDRRSKYEINEWLQTRVDNRAKLATVVERQVKAELHLVREIAVEERAEKTTTAVDDLLVDRQRRHNELVSRIQEQMKAMRRRIRAPRGGYRGRYGTARRRNSAYSQTRRLPAGDQLKGQDELRQQERGLEVTGEKNGLEIQQWLQPGMGNRANLAQAVYEQVEAELVAIRKIADGEKAAKTTAAIDGVLLTRQERLDRLIKIWQGLSGILVPTQGQRGYYRGRYPSPRQEYLPQPWTGGQPGESDTAEQQQYMQEEDVLPRPRR